MILLKKLLLAMDFTASSELVMDAAIEMAKIFGSTIIPIHILPDDLENEKVKKLVIETANEKLSQIVTRIRAHELTVEDPILEFGSPSQKLVEVATSLSVNLVIIGSGERQKEKFQLGITAERIIQKSDKPVFVVKAGSSLQVNHILCPVDFSKTSARALRNAITFAHRFNAELNILSVCESPGFAWFASEKDKEIEEESRCSRHQAQFETFLQDFNLSGLKWTKETRRGSAAEEIIQSIATQNIDLLVMGTVGRAGLARVLMGSVTEKVIRELPCSFVTLKAKDAIQLQMEHTIKDVDLHYQNALQLMESGFFEEALGQFRICLSMQNMHVPSYFGMAKVYDRLGETEKAQKHRDSAYEIMERMYYTKIEEEVRKSRGN